MSRKLYALVILIGALAALVLAYLYFFVYYTSSLTINSNVSDYKVELFSKSTAQKWEHDCPQEKCLIADVSPFDYNISISKDGYKTKIITAKVAARSREEILINLEKLTILSSLEEKPENETPQEKIQRLRDEKTSFARFAISADKVINFVENQGQLEMQYKGKSVTKFPITPKEQISVDNILGTQDIFISLAGRYYIFDTLGSSLEKLPYEVDVKYIKEAKINNGYLVVTEKGTFLYDRVTKKSLFQYLFKDFVYYDDSLIGVIYDYEDEKKSNYNISKKGNLIIKYNPKDKTRKILLDTDLAIDRIQWKDDTIIFSVGEKNYELQNF